MNNFEEKMKNFAEKAKLHELAMCIKELLHKFEEQEGIKVIHLYTSWIDRTDSKPGHEVTTISVLPNQIVITERDWNEEAREAQRLAEEKEHGGKVLSDVWSDIPTVKGE